MMMSVSITLSRKFAWTAKRSRSPKLPPFWLPFDRMFYGHILFRTYKFPYVKSIAHKSFCQAYFKHLPILMLAPEVEISHIKLMPLHKKLVGIKHVTARSQLFNWFLFYLSKSDYERASIESIIRSCKYICSLHPLISCFITNFSNPTHNAFLYLIRRIANLQCRVELFLDTPRAHEPP